MQFEFSRKPENFSSSLQEIRLQNTSWSRGSPNSKIKKNKILSSKLFLSLDFCKICFVKVLAEKNSNV